MSVANRLSINFDRLKSNINAISQIGRSQDHGIYRQAFTENDLQARGWLSQKMEEAGLHIEVDGAANIHGYLGDRSKPSVVVGSHIDSVPAAGPLDGTLGVLTGLECLQRIKEEGLELGYPLELVSFSDEEGRFGGLLGSQSFVGDINPQRIYNSRDLNGVSLVDAMKACGYDAIQALDARRNPRSVKSYLELHIEQGPVLDSLDVPIGVVSHITGLFKWSIRLIGRPDHAGTTPMPMRADALAGLAEFSMEIPRVLEENGTERSVATIGKVDLFPGTANTVPGKVEFSLDCRDTDSKILQDLMDAFRKALSAIARRRDLMFEFDVLSEVDPVACDDSIQAIIRKASESVGCNHHSMPSGAAHDAQIVARIAPVGMIFVPSKAGRSHSSAEWTDWEDIETGANVALQSLLQMAEARI
ncbi:MAG: Zn-dependent hydrolase [Leptospiraceae bacterium]|nr:Zn-dependent hydrolase [Leptospiraceae bacterium]MCB1303060.1 Zn-dependent hydrolase [Leptospiraceae bacterium]